MSSSVPGSRYFSGNRFGDRYTQKMTATTAASTPSAAQACARSSGNAAHTPIAATSPSSPIFTTRPVSEADCGGGPGRRGGRATTSGAESTRAAGSLRDPPSAVAVLRLTNNPARAASPADPDRSLIRSLRSLTGHLILSAIALPAAWTVVAGSAPPTTAASALPNGSQIAAISGIAGRIAPF